MNNLCVNCPTKKQAACLECAKCGVTVACENYGEMLLLRDNMTESTSDVITDGLKHDGGKPRLDLVPPEIIEAVGTVMTHGAEKYGEASYRQVEPKRYRAALMRHICKWLKDPYGKDEDSGLPHLWHIACNVAFLLELDKPERVEAKSETRFNQCNKNSLKLKRVTTNNERWLVADTKWVCIKSGKNKTWVCPKCDTIGSPQWVCCPVCGTDMKGEEE